MISTCSKCLSGHPLWCWLKSKLHWSLISYRAMLHSYESFLRVPRCQKVSNLVTHYSTDFCGFWKRILGLGFYINGDFAKKCDFWMKISGFWFVKILGKKYGSKMDIYKNGYLPKLNILENWYVSKMDICMENWIFFKIGPGSFYLFLTIWLVYSHFNHCRLTRMHT